MDWDQFTQDWFYWGLPSGNGFDTNNANVWQYYQGPNTGNPATETMVSSPTVTGTWIPDANNPTPPSGSQYFLVEAMADATVTRVPSGNDPAAPVDGSGMEVDDGYGDSGVTTQGVAQGYPWVDMISQGKHLIQMGSSGNTVTISKNLKAMATAQDGSGDDFAPSTGESFVVYPDTRGVNVSSGLEPTYYKDSNGQRAVNQRGTDGSMTADTISTVYDFKNQTFITYHAQAIGNWTPNSSFDWKLEHGLPSFFFASPSGTFTLPNDPPNDYEAQYGLNEAGIPDNQDYPSEHVTIDLKDSGDSADATGNYTVNFHDPMENWQNIGSAKVLPSPQIIPSSLPKDSTGLAGYATDGGSVSGQWEVTTDEGGEDTALSQMLSMITGFIDPKWAGFLNAAGIGIGDLEPQSPGVTSVGFDDAWDKPYSTWNGSNNCPGSSDLIKSLYKMFPCLALFYTKEYWQADGYDTHGYTGPVNEDYNQLTGVIGCGEFVYIGSTSPPSS